MDPALERRARELLARASVIAEASASDYEARGRSAGGRGHVILMATDVSTFDRWRRRFQHCRTDQDLAKAIADVEDELDLLEHGPPREVESAAQFRFRLVEQHEGRNYRQVASIENVSVAYVRKIREEAGRRPLDGREA
jgi:hypothetical protein